MSTSFSTPLVVAALSLAVLTACSDSRSDAPPTEPHALAGVQSALSSGPGDVPGARKEIGPIYAALDAAWNAGNATAYAAPFADDVRLTAPTGALIVSREGVRQLHAFLFSGPMAGSIRTTTALEITFLTGSLAVVDRTGDVTNYAFLPPGAVPTLPGVLRARERHVLEKRNGSWTIVFAQLTPVAPGV